MPLEPLPALTVRAPPDDDGIRSRGPYDPEPKPEADLWFLRGDDDPAEMDASQPVARRAPERLFDPDDWRQAQGTLAADLADLAMLYGALDQRLAATPPEVRGGWRQRLALMEVADLGWWTGDRIGIERLALWVGMRIGAPGDDAMALARSGWAVRRLSSGPPPGAGGWESGLGAFLGRTGPDNGAVPEAIADLADVMREAASLHPVTGAAMLFHAWRLLATDHAQPLADLPERLVAGQRGAQESLAVLEAAVLAARQGAVMGRSAAAGRGALFLPLALTGPTALRASGPVERRLAAWLTGATQATQGALLHLDRLGDWRERAAAATGDLTGRTARQLVGVLAAWPVVSAPMAGQATGASRAAVQRNLDRLQARGLIREITGQGRYRVWAATL